MSGVYVKRQVLEDLHSSILTQLDENGKARIELTRLARIVKEVLDDLTPTVRAPSTASFQAVGRILSESLVEKPKNTNRPK